MKIHLYVKQCSHCGLKYFGKTTKDYLKYKGSGHHWLRHIKLHGSDKVQTIEAWTFDTQSEAYKFAMDFSFKNDIVESKEWANLIPENGLDGNSSEVITEKLRKKFAEANTGSKNPSYGKYWWNNGVEERKSKNQPDVEWTRGRIFSEEHQKKFNHRVKDGERNPSYGKYWWTNGVDSIKSETCPNGYYRGVGSKFRSKSSNKRTS